MVYAIKIATFCILSVLCLSSKAKSLEEKPHLQDWFEAEWFDNLVKIPLLIDQKTLWYANLIAGLNQEDETTQTGGYCMVDNNAATTVIFIDINTGLPWYEEDGSGAICGDEETQIMEDGADFKGVNCRQELCIGSWQYQLDEHTTVCNADQPFVLADQVIWGEWTYYYNFWGQTNAICGLGKEEASSRSQSFISLAVENGDLEHNIYSFEIDPHLSLLSSSRAHYEMKVATEGDDELVAGEHPKIEKRHKLGKTPFEFELESVSNLILGGYDTNDFEGDMTWYDTSECIGGWNLTSTALDIGGSSILNNETGPNVEFQTAYPYIGLPEQSWIKYIEIVSNTWNPDLIDSFNCGGWNDQIYCYWRKVTCDEVNLPGSFDIQIGNMNYSIPMEYLVAEAQLSLRTDCDLYFAQLRDKYGNNIRLGDPFFSQILPVFDVENDQLGLALSSRALDGVTVTDVTVDPVDPVEPVEFALRQESPEISLTQQLLEINQ